MSNHRYHFVLVHGVCLGAWCWYKLVTLLRSNERTKVTAVDMACSGRDPNQVKDVPTLSDYLKPLLATLEALPEDEKVILVGHSRGGIDISLAMERYPRKISAAIFISASMPSPTFDVSTISKEFERMLDFPENDSKFTFDNGKDRPPTSVLSGPKFLETLLYNRSPPEDLVLATLLVRPSPLYEDFSRPTKETVLTEQNYGSIRRVYVVCEQDRLMKVEFQRWLIDRNPPDELRVIKGSDHMVMTSKPEELCMCLIEIAEKYCP